MNCSRTYFLLILTFSVDGGQRGLIFDKLRGGIQEKVRGEGTHFYVPILQRPILYDVKITPRDIQTETGTKGMIPIKIKKNNN